MDTNDVKGLNVKRLSTVLIVIEAVLFGLSMIFAVQVSKSYKKVNWITDYYIKTQGNIDNLQIASDYLTSKVRQYVMTGELMYAEQYFEEVNVTKRRENAIENIKETISEVGSGASGHIENGLEKSNTLMDREIYAMALIASLADSEKRAKLPEVLTEYPLSVADLKLTPEERTEKAYSQVFGTSYSNKKMSIRQSVDDATDELLGELAEYKSECTAKYRVAFAVLMLLLAFSVITFSIITICLFKLILKPLTTSIDAIKEKQHIPYSKSNELNYLAATYNTVYEENAQTRRQLKNKADRDELTGLLNRSAFNELVDIYKNVKEDIAFLLIDVDHFKSINDTYGHSVGDMALQRVAALLEESFRSNDFPIRYGGDEFAIIMTEFGEAQKAVLERKIKYINDALLNPTDDRIPKFSLSFGIAFSTHGFDANLVERADAALYKTKENGRAGYTFSKGTL